MSETTGTRRSRPGFLRAVTRRFGTWPLFGVILVWVVLALVVFTVLGWLWGEGPLWSWQRWLTNWRGASAGAGSLDLVKVSLTTIGGIGGTGYLVIKYRERASAERAERDAEQDRAEQRLLSGVQQLGSGSPQVRIAGVYSLANVADTYRGEYRQRVVSILCGYLRTQRGERETAVNEQDGPEQSSEEKVYVSHDGAVESTVLEVLVRHLRKRCEKTKHREAVTQLVEDDQLWCDCTIDLHDAVLTEIADFRGATFNRYADFRGATFNRYANFRGATFNRYANFQDATFNRDADFWGATFTNVADFLGATFNRYADFWGATFNRYADFGGATFTNVADFLGATFTNSANFLGATFSRSAPPRGLPPEQVDEDGLPHGARWADADDEGLEAGSPDDAPR
ncbi:pentapeptide repeat-containing protein [uncultured Actinomyces sp.]|uniref:pentapeptide repeat-containing protein n=1 Tax=uncultured Actinomyces sp. TaxID=249061 RepID=UPI0028E3505F|nr:pentapeptide repeat-containing protein [uncultured Actinomyces sp.]